MGGIRKSDIDSKIAQAIDISSLIYVEHEDCFGILRKDTYLPLKLVRVRSKFDEGRYDIYAYLLNLAQIHDKVTIRPVLTRELHSVGILNLYFKGSEELELKFDFHCKLKKLDGAEYVTGIKNRGFDI